MADFGQYGFGNGKTVPKPDKLGGDVKKKILVVLLMLSCLTAYCASGEQFFDR